MWIHLGGSYWQRASWDAVFVVAAALSLISYAPTFRQFSSQHWKIAIALFIMGVVFFLMLVESFQYMDKAITHRLLQIEINGPS
jgi:hypothetical protein